MKKNRLFITAVVTIGTFAVALALTPVGTTPLYGQTLSDAELEVNVGCCYPEGLVETLYCYKKIQRCSDKDGTSKSTCEDYDKQDYCGNELGTKNGEDIGDQKLGDSQDCDESYDEWDCKWDPHSTSCYPIGNSRSENCGSKNVAEPAC